MRVREFARRARGRVSRPGPAFIIRIYAVEPLGRGIASVGCADREIYI